jgi:hypothetical protein
VRKWGGAGKHRKRESAQKAELTHNAVSNSSTISKLAKAVAEHWIFLLTLFLFLVSLSVFYISMIEFNNMFAHYVWNDLHVVEVWSYPWINSHFQFIWVKIYLENGVWYNFMYVLMGMGLVTSCLCMFKLGYEIGQVMLKRKKT